MNRRELLKTAAALPLLQVGLSNPGSAQAAWPNHTITMIVPFRGAGPALTALLGGTVQALASAPGTLKQQVDDGKMRVLANWGASRIASFPDLPTFRELGYKDVEFYIWAGVFAQSALPAPIMTKLRQSMAQAVKSPDVTKPLETAGSPVAYLDAPEFATFVADDSARLIAAVKKIGKVE